jgi:hypothetical protein
MKVLVRRLSSNKVISLDKLEEHIKSVIGDRNAYISHQLWYDEIDDDLAIKEYIIMGTKGYDWVAYEMPTDPVYCFRMGFKWPSKLIEHRYILFGRDDFIVNPSETTKEEIRKIVEECKESVSKMFRECLDELYHRNVTFETDDLVLSLTQKEYGNLINKRDTHGKVIRKHEIFSDESTDVQIRWIIDKEGVEKLRIRGSILFFRGETEAIEDLIDVVKKHIKEKIKER